MAVTRVVMPKLSEAMETGKLIKWLKQEGERVQGGDVIAEIETDKADVEMEAFGAGVLRRILVQAGGRVPVGQMIAVIAEPSDDISAVLTEAPAAPAQETSAPAAAATTPPPAAAPVSAPVPTPVPASTSAPPPAVAPTGGGTAVSASARVKASPLARKIAAQSGVDLGLVQGSGPGGRIIRKDVETAAARPRPAAVTAVAPSVPATTIAPSIAVAAAEYEDVPLSSIRAAIAKRMPLSKSPVPHFYVTSEVAMDPAWALRAELNALDGQPKISVNDLIVRACALALLRHPGVNASFQGETIRVHHRAHIGIAVALDEGLITPVLRDCHAKSLPRIAVEAADLAERARARRLKATEMGGGTFSISNLGMFDVAEFSAIINPPEGAILAVGSVRTVPVVEGDRVGIGRRVHLTLSCDHRVMDGAMGARFLQEVKHLLEEPLRLLV